jgi:hypothetical protein
MNRLQFLSDFKQWFRRMLALNHKPLSEPTGNLM